MKPPYLCTPKQYKEQIIKARMAEYGCSRADAEYGLIDTEVERLHLEQALAAADAGEVIPKTVLDAMGVAAWNVIKWHAKDYPGYQPKATERGTDARK